MVLMHSSVSLWHFWNVIVLFFAVVDDLDCIGILSSGDWLLSLLIGDEWLGLIQVINFTFRESKSVSLVQFSPGWWHQVRSGQEEKLWHVEHVKELLTISDIKPHPISVRLQSNGLKSKDLQEVGSSSCIPMGSRLVLIEEFGIVVLDIVIVRVPSFISTHLLVDNIIN